MSDLHELAEEYFQATLEASPFGATQLGIEGFDAEVPDVAEETQERYADRLDELARRVEAVEASSLRDSDRVTRSMLLHEYGTAVRKLRSGSVELAVTGPMSAQAVVLGSVPKVVLDSGSRVNDYASRCKRLPEYVDQVAGRLSAGTRRGRTSTHRSVTQALAEIDAYLRLPLDTDPLVAPAAAHSADAAAQIVAVVASDVRPAFQRLRDAIAGVVAPAARDDDHCGLLYVPGGEQSYADALIEHTSLSLTAQQIHDLGVGLCEDLATELVERGRTALGAASEPAELRERLRSDPSLRYDNSEQILTDARAALARAEGALPSWFLSGEMAACSVEEMNSVEAPHAVLGYYQPPAADGSRPGRHWINTWQPTTRTRYEYEALAFHESVPGHHLQLARAQGLVDLPQFRRFAYVAAYSEGWGMYAERLADEMNLYSSDIARLGMVSFDAWRAARLVVDTGMHALGWSRSRAIEFLRDATSLTDSNVVNEVDRYVSWPGQATAYMLGRQEMHRLRARSDAAGLDVKQFHDVVLRGGAMPLPTLTDEVERALAAA